MRTQRLKAMKVYRNTASGTVLLLLVGMLLASCDGFLEEPPRGSLAGPVLANSNGVDALLIGAYAGLSPTGSWDASNVAETNAWEAAADNWVFGTVMGGDAKKGSDATDQTNINPLMRGNPDPNNGFLNSQWRVKYDAIARANAVLSLLEELPEGELSDAERANVAGQARFLRGHHYFELRRQFGMVPWIDENTTDYDQPNDVDIWPMIEDDFEFGMNNMSATQPERGRANSWAAAAYLGKTYLYQEKWDEAADLFETVILQGNTADGQAYDLVDNFHDNFFPPEQHNSEAVFMIEFTGDDGVTGSIFNSRNGSMLNYPYNSPFGCCGFLQPSQDLVNSYRTIDGLPPVGQHNAETVTSDQGVGASEQFELYEGTLDPRLDWTVGRRGVPYLDWGPHPGARWIRDQAYAGPYGPKKHVYMRSRQNEDNNAGSWAPGSAVNHHVIRFADVLLMAAEAEAERGNADQARQYVNRVRSRAATESGRVQNAHNEAYAVAVVDNEADMLALDVVQNDWVVRTDRNSTFVLLVGGENAGANIDNWQEYTEPNYEVAEYTAAEFGTGGDAVEKVRFERKLELSMEGHRMFDLLRWDVASQVLNDYFAYEGQLSLDVQGAQFRMPSQYFPIPQRQIDLSLDRLQQNQGY